MVLVTSLPYGIEATAQLYRDRADSENPCLMEAAEQLSQYERWRLILSRIFIKYLNGRILAGPEAILMSG